MSATGKVEKNLVSEGLVSEEQLKSALDLRKKENVRLGTALVRLGHVNENVLATFLSKIYGVPAVSLDGVEIPPEVTQIIPKAICEKKILIPLSAERGRLTVAIADPTDISSVDDVRFLSNMDVLVYISTETSILDAIKRAYSAQENQHVSEMDMMDAGMDLMERNEAATGAIQLDNSEEEVQLEKQDQGDNKPTIRIVNKLIYEGIERKVSDIHIEPFQDHLRARFRMDGTLYEVMRIPNELRTSVPARIKVMSSLDISESRLPQDGRIQVRTRTRSVDIRVSLIPTAYGEKVVMRILGQGSEKPDLEKSGFEGDQLKVFRESSKQPYGMVLVTGPTGSGKSTTLYGILHEINSPKVNICTVEDPIEIKMEGVNQTQMKERIGLTFAFALRSLLRQDPDIIMLGEIRDQETAEIAIKAALTGHMVFSTLHTNDAASSVTRLVHMGVEPYLITAALTLVQAQRLMRALCSACKVEDTKVTERQLLAAEVPPEMIGQFKPMRPMGCKRCGDTGYKGRKGIFEVLPVTEVIREMVIRGSNSDDIKKKALEEGMLSLRQSALEKFYRGETSLAEVLNHSRGDKDMDKGNIDG